ncbi:MAG: hypothetical protein ABIT37_01905 [Luteolibacter sp.]
MQTTQRRWRKVTWNEPQQREPRSLRGTLKLFAFLLGWSFLLGSAGYFLLWAVMPEGWVFGALYRMFLYHWAHPLQYIGLVSFHYAVVANVGISLPGNPVGRWPRLVIPLIIILSIVLASPTGGVLWAIHDMQAGYFPEDRRFWEAIRWGAVEGMTTGWLVILLSVPYNILGFVVGYQLTLRAYRMTLRSQSSSDPTSGALQTLAQAGTKLPNKRP